MVITTLSLINLKDELLNRLRAGLNEADPKHRVTEKVSQVVSDGVSNIFFLSPSLSYVSSVLVNDVKLFYLRDWDISWRADNQGSIILKDVPASGAVIKITYGEKDSGNFIYPDLPRTDLGESSMPRIGFRLSISSRGGGFINPIQQVFRHNILLQIKVVGDSTYIVDYLCERVNEYLKSNVRNFYYFHYIRPSSLENFDNYSDNTEQNYSRVLQYEIPDKLEIINQDEEMI